METAIVYNFADVEECQSYLVSDHLELRLDVVGWVMISEISHLGSHSARRTTFSVLLQVLLRQVGNHIFYESFRGEV